MNEELIRYNQAILAAEAGGFTTFADALRADFAKYIERLKILGLWSHREQAS